MGQRLFSVSVSLHKDPSEIIPGTVVGHVFTTADYGFARAVVE